MEGTVAAAEFELAKESTDPEGPAHPLSFTLAVTGVFESPATDVGVNNRLATVAGKMVTEQVLVFDPTFAVIVTTVIASTPAVVMAKFVEVAPAGIVTEPGTVRHDWFELSETTMPLTGAFPVSMTTPGFGVLPPTIWYVDGVCTPSNPTAVMLRTEVAEDPARLAEIVDVWSDATRKWAIVKVAA